MNATTASPRPILSAITVASLLWAAPAAAANDGFSYSNASWPAIEVSASHYQYVSAVAVAPAWQADIQIDPPGIGRVKHWEVYPHVGTAVDLNQPGKPIPPSLESFKIHKTYPAGALPFKVEQTVGGQLPVLASWAVQQCQALRAKLEAEGQSLEQIFSVDQPIPLNWRLKYQYSYIWDGGFRSGQEGKVFAPTQSVILCKRWANPAAQGVAGMAPELPDFELIDADFNLFHTAAAQCPKDILLSSKVRSTTAGEIKLWYEIQDAQAGSRKSKPYILTTGTVGAGGYVETEHTDTVSMPLSKLQVNESGTSAGFDADTAGLLPGGSGGDSGAAPLLPGSSVDIANEAGGGSNEHSGKIRVVAKRTNLPKLGGLLGGGHQVVSPWRDYHFSCEPQVSGMVQNLPGNMAPATAPDGTSMPQAGFGTSAGRFTSKTPAHSVGVVKLPQTAPSMSAAQAMVMTPPAPRMPASGPANRRNKALAAKRILRRAPVRGGENNAATEMVSAQQPEVAPQPARLGRRQTVAAAKPNPRVEEAGDPDIRIAAANRNRQQVVVSIGNGGTADAIDCSVKIHARTASGKVLAQARVPKVTSGQSVRRTLDTGQRRPMPMVATVGCANEPGTNIGNNTLAVN